MNGHKIFHGAQHFGYDVEKYSFDWGRIKVSKNKQARASISLDLVVIVMLPATHSPTHLLTPDET